MLIFWPISSLGDAYKRYLSDAYKQKNMYFPKYAFIALMLIYVNFVVDVNYFAMK